MSRLADVNDHYLTDPARASALRLCRGLIEAHATDGGIREGLELASRLPAGGKLDRLLTGYAVALFALSVIEELRAAGIGDAELKLTALSIDDVRGAFCDATSDLAGLATERLPIAA